MILADIITLWNNSWPAGLTMLVLGVGFSIVLLIANKKLHVEVDPTIDRIYNALPRIDCGTCGFAGCASYAKAVTADPLLLGRCAPGGSACSQMIAQILNLQVSGGGAPRRPVVFCRAHKDDRTYFGDYSGISTCTAANAMANVQACKFGCLGFGDCKSSCKFSSIQIIDGLATIDYSKCTGCGACAKACPRGLIEMMPFTHDVMMTVACKSQESGKDTRAFCKVGCIACKLCTKQTDAFAMTGNLARLDFERYQPGEPFETAMKKCPTGVIVYRGKEQK
ncbi:MAG: hypothetical protein A2Y10_10790 [Planctomycetes bacterium GWF2_41_51]|nr:MAG: hypothetical protein A2Y10_10790 [Planctomycetes bacterium GWF2_41_51]HBG28468.1 electron transporter RnfB [Phycisphaerales bacterium]